MGLEEEVELTDSEQEGQEEEADTLGEAVEKAEGILVGVAVDPLISDKLTYRSA